MLNVETIDSPSSSGAPSERLLEAMRRQYAAIDHPMSFTVVCVAENDHEIWLRRTFSSVLAQVHQRVELCVCTISAKERSQQVLADLGPHDPRVRPVVRSGSTTTGNAVRAALGGSGGDFVVFIDPGDTLRPDALFRAAESIARRDADVVYSDEELIDEVDQRIATVRKPYYSPELHLSTPYIGRFCAIRRSLLEDVGAPTAHEAWEHDLMLRVCERAGAVRHLPLALYGRRILPDRESGDADRALVHATRKALDRRGETGLVAAGLAENSLRIMRKPSRHPRISVILSLPEAAPRAPFERDLERRTGLELEQVIVAGGAPGAVPGAERIEAFTPAAGANRAAERATGDLLLFASGRLRLGPGTAPGWLGGLAALAQRPGAGAVGCRVTDAEGALRYGGVAVDLSPLSPEAGLDHDGATAPITLHPTNPAFVSAYLMLIDAAVFAEVGGFNEANLPSALYDLDLGLRLIESGRLNVYSPYVTVVAPPAQRYPGAAEIAYVWERWWQQLDHMLGHQPGGVPAARGLDPQPASFIEGLAG